VGRGAAALVVLGSVLLLAACERPPMQAKQIGYRGTGMEQVDNPRLLAKAAAARPALPPELPALPDVPGGPRAKDVFKSVQVLGDLPVADFTRHMTAITSWLNPPEGCNYCHVPDNLADDSKYTKRVARRMLQMTRHVNSDWTRHVQKTGVTCYTCHRGKVLPEYVWFKPVVPARNQFGSLLGNDNGQNKVDLSIAFTSMDYDPFSGFLDGNEEIRIYGPQALPSDHAVTIQRAEKTYSLMNFISGALGVNCTFCHNTRSFASWEGPPQRVNAWHGIRMVRDLNINYAIPLASSYPKERLGPMGDPAKIFCATCHQGQNKPLGGVALAPAYVGFMPPPAKPVAPLPAPLVEARKSVLFFGIASSQLEGEQAKGLDRLIATMGTQARTVATISGYHSASGPLEANQELAKQRAFAVRDALKSAGIAESRIRLLKPQATGPEGNEEDPAARRVEVTLR
jgi:photosynthetic reaction center cytochrome c subunit